MDQMSVDERDILLRVSRERIDTKAFIRQMSTADLELTKRVGQDLWNVALQEQSRRTDIERRKREAEAKKKDA